MRETISLDRVLLALLLATLAENITTTDVRPNDLLEIISNLEGWLSGTYLFRDLRETVQGKIDELKELTNKADWASQAQTPIYELVELLCKE